jgi:hypothetical protein
MKSRRTDRFLSFSGFFMLDNLPTFVYNNCMMISGVCSMKYLSVKETSVKWGISVRRVLQYLKDDRIYGAYMMGSTWAIPENAEKPIDPRKKRKQDFNE